LKEAAVSVFKETKEAAKSEQAQKLREGVGSLYDKSLDKMNK